MTDLTDSALRGELRRFKAYPAYKDSGVEWLGAIPAGWDVGPLKYLTSFTTGWTPPTGREDFYGGEYLWANIGDLGAKFLHDTENTITDVAIREARLRIVPAGSLLFSFKLSVGAVSIAGIDMYTNEAIAAFSPSESIDTGFLYWAAPILLPHSAQENIYGAPLLSRERIANAGMLSPSLTEQRTIAVFLDRETARIDALVAKKEQLITLLHERRTALITRAVTKGLDPAAPMKDSGVEWLGKIPAHWKVTRIKTVARLGNGSTPSRENPEYWGGNFPWLNSSVVSLDGVQEGSDFVTSTALRECHLPKIIPPAVLVAITGEGRTRGMATILRIEATISQHLVAIQPARVDVDIDFLRFVLVATYQYLRDVSGGAGSTKGALTCEQLGNLAVPFPLLREQEAIATFVRSTLIHTDALIHRIRAAIARLHELRIALISAAVTGKIDVSGTAE